MLLKNAPATLWKLLLIVATVLLHSSLANAQHIITTVAGGGPANNVPALQASIGAPASIYKDSAGNLYIASETLDAIFKVDGNGRLTTVAGIAGGPGFGGDGGPATVSHLSTPRGVFVNQLGDIYISDSINNRIRKVVASTGNIQTVVGNGTAGFSGDGGPATSAELDFPAGVFVDSGGNIFIMDTTNNRVRKVTAATGVIQTVAGNGTAGFSGDGGPAINAELNLAGCAFCGVSVDGAGNIFIADSGNNRIREVLAANGNIVTFAGNGTAGSTGDGGPATSAELNFPGGVFLDGQGNLFIAEINNAGVREVVASTGNIQTVPLSSGLLPSSVFVDTSGHLFVADFVSASIVEVAAGSPNSTVAGNGTLGFSGDGGPASGAQLYIPSGVVVDSNGNIFFADSANSRVREVIAASGTIQTVAGNGTLGFSGDGGPATSAQIDIPTGVFVDAAGNLFFSDLVNNRIRRVDATTKVITTVAGSETQGFGGDGGPATSASLFNPGGLYVDSAGNIFIADSQNCRIREVLASTNIIQTVAGNGTCAFGGDGGAATSAELNLPLSVFVDAAGNIYIGDTGNLRIREVLAATKIIQTVAGNGTPGFSGDGGPATAAQLGPVGVFIDRTGNLFLWDIVNNRIREVVAATGNIETVVGNGTYGFSGDGGPAINAEIASASFFAGVWGDTNNNLYLSDSGNARIRKVTGLVAGAPTSITATSGTPQSAAISTAFPSPLAATVTDAFGNAVAGVTVTFTAPTSGATGTFVGGLSTATASTNGAGVATSPVFTANGTLGSYVVTATAAGVSGSAAFNLANSTLAITTTTLPPATVGTAYSATLQATGGVLPYTWSISAGTLPGGLTLNSSTGAITGTPSSGGTSTFTVKVTDSETPAVSQSAGLSISVSGNLGTLVVLPQPNTVGFGSSVQFYAQDGSGNAIPATWSVSPATGAGTISASGGLYQAPASVSTAQTVTVTSAAITDSTKQKSVSFTLAPNGLNACCTLPQQLTVASGGTSTPTGVQLNGTPVKTASTVPFALSCVGLPAGAGCIFSLPHSSTTIQSISGTSPTAFCYVFTTGSGATTTGMISRLSRKNPASPILPIYPVVILCIGVVALVSRIWICNEAGNSKRLSFAIVAVVCISVGVLEACNGFSKANVAPPSAQTTPAGTYHIEILATPPTGSGFVQNQLIVPLTVTQ